MLLLVVKDAGSMSAARTTLPVLCPSACLLSPRLSQLAGDSPIEGGVGRLLLLVEPQRGKLECVKNIAKIQFRHVRNRLRDGVRGSISHSAPLRDRRYVSCRESRIGGYDLDNDRRDVVDAAVVIRVRDHCVHYSLRIRAGLKELLKALVFDHAGKPVARQQEDITDVSFARQDIRLDVAAHADAAGDDIALRVMPCLLGGDQAGIDLILVGDSASMVFAGNDTTLPMKMDEMLYHVRVVTKAVKRALVVADMPFMSYHQGADQALGNAGRLMQDGLAEAVKLEGGESICPIVHRIVDAGIPVMGHIGLQPQSIHTYGTYKTRGSDPAEAERIVAEAHALEDAGAFAVVVEKVPAPLAKRISGELRIPTIGIGAGAGCDGQILVTPDMLGLTTQFNPRFVRKYGRLSDDMLSAFQRYRDDVKQRTFPTDAESY